MSELAEQVIRNTELNNQLLKAEQIIERYANTSTWVPMVPDDNHKPQIKNDSEIVGGIKVGGKQARAYMTDKKKRQRKLYYEL